MRERLDSGNRHESLAQRKGRVVVLELRDDLIEELDGHSVIDSISAISTHQCRKMLERTLVQQCHMVDVYGEAGQALLSQAIYFLQGSTYPAKRFSDVRAVTQADRFPFSQMEIELLDIILRTLKRVYPDDVDQDSAEAVQHIITIAATRQR